MPFPASGMCSANGLLRNSGRAITNNGGTVHDSALRAVIITGVMLGYPVIPDHKIMLLPVPADTKLRPGTLGKQKIQQGTAFLVIQFGNLTGKPG